MKNSLIHSTLKYSVAIPALKTSRVKSNSDVPGSDPDGPNRRNLTSLSRCTAFMLSPTLMHWRYIIKLQHGNHKLPSASIVKKNRKNKGGIKKMKYRVRRWQCRNPQGLLTNVWPQTCGVERRRGMGKIWVYWKEKHCVAGETQSNSSKSPGSQSLYRLLPYWLLHWFKTTCYCVMKHHCK